MDAPILRRSCQLEAEGWSDAQIARAVRSGELVRVARSVYRWAGDLDPTRAHVVRARAITLRQGPAVVVSHQSAAAVHGLPLGTPDPGVVHLTVEPPGRVRKRSGYHVHVAPLRAEDVVEVDGLRVTSLARTVADLARTTDHAWAVAAADQALRRGVPRTALLECADAAARLAGARRIEKVALFADARADSVAESLSRVTLFRAGIPTPSLQFEVVGPNGWAATSDFGWPEHGVVGEMDGRIKYGRLLKPGQTAQDAAMAQIRRDEAIRQAGWWPCHWGWEEACNVRALGALVRGAFAAAARR